jgi:hypothetical protein
MRGGSTYKKTRKKKNGKLHARTVRTLPQNPLLSVTLTLCSFQRCRNENDRVILPCDTLAGRVTEPGSKIRSHFMRHHRWRTPLSSWLFSVHTTSFMQEHANPQGLAWGLEEGVQYNWYTVLCSTAADLSQPPADALLRSTRSHCFSRLPHSQNTEWPWPELRSRILVINNPC